MTANGEVPSSQLTTVQGSIQLETATAAAWARMKLAASSAGVNLTIATPAGGYRSRAVQQDMRDNPERYNLNPSSSVGLAPVGQSTHGFGTRVDIGTSSGNSWAIANGASWGFVRSDFGSDDNNHYTYTGAIAPTQPQPVFGGLQNMFLVNGTGIPSQYYLGVYDGRTLKIRPTYGLEAKILLNAQPPIARAQVTDPELVDICSQGGYVAGQPYQN